MRTINLFLICLTTCLFISCNNETIPNSDNAAETEKLAAGTQQKKTEAIEIKQVPKSKSMSMYEIPKILNQDELNKELEIVPGTKFGLRLNESATLKEDGISIVVNKINDSRCPPNVQCVRAGEIDATLTIQQGDKELEFVLTSPTKEKPNSTDNVNISKYNVKLLGAVDMKALKKAKAAKGEPFEIYKEKEIILELIVNPIAEKKE